METDEGRESVVDAVHKRDRLTEFTEVFTDFTLTLAKRRNVSKTFRNYEARFSALAAKLRRHNQTVSVHGFFFALLLLAHSGAYDSQRVSVLAAAASSHSNLTVEKQGSDVKAVQHATHESVTSVLRQCDNNGAEDFSKSQQWH